MNALKDSLERSAFGVCEYLGNKFGIASTRVRLYFIYATFVALGSPVLFYLILAFWVNLRKYVKKARIPVWN